MLTPNGGVFGRNPTFNNVTVENNLTVNGDFTLGDDIVINDTLLVNGQATFRGGIISIPNSAAPTSNTVIGSGAGTALASGAVMNVVIGADAGKAIVNSDYNVAIGGQALRGFDAALNTAVGYNAMGAFASGNTGALNTTVGYNAGASIRGGGQNVAVGSDAGSTNQNASSTVTVGYQAATLNTASDITAVGANALDANTTGVRLVAVGKDALGANTASDNTAVGHAALAANQAGSGNTAVGSGALDALVTNTNDNTAVGSTALGALTDGSSNVAVGAGAAGSLNVSGTPQNGVTAVGGYALLSATSAASTTAIGISAGRFVASGAACTSATNSVFIGANSRAADNGQDNQVVIAGSVAGVGGIGNGSNTTTIGNSSTTGTFIPAGNLTLTNGNFIVGTSGKGIDFGITTSGTGTMTSELLSDYEEGTWTPAYSTDGTGFTTMTMDGVTVGRYTKIGRMVTVFAFLTTDNVNATGATGTVTVTGLPFTVSGSSGFFAGSIAFMRLFAASGFPCAVYAETSTTYLKLEKRAASNGTTAFLAPADLVAGANNDHNQLMICLSYFV